MSILVLGARMGTHPQLLSDVRINYLALRMSMLNSALQLYGQRTVFVPKMPALGLLLEEPLFDSYNQRMTVINERFKPTDPDYRPLIDFNQHRDKMDAFKEEFIYKTMRQVEDKEGLYVTSPQNAFST